MGGWRCHPPAMEGPFLRDWANEYYETKHDTNDRIGFLLCVSQYVNCRRPCGRYYVSRRMR
jgi:hypothetical protein